MLRYLKDKLPPTLRRRLSGVPALLTRVHNRVRDTRDVFDDVYRLNRWGGARGELCSGSGSRGPAADLYIETVRRFIAERGVKSIVDIGCGDFHVAGRILEAVAPDVTYVGLDAAQSAVKANSSRFTRPGVSFRWANAVTDNLPAADLCLIRQVLQHLSNDQIAAILAKIPRYRWTIITEHYPPQRRFTAFNSDKVQGHDTRVIRGSGVYLDLPPYRLQGISLLAEIAVDSDEPVLEGFIRTWLIESRGGF
jgi:SAM-dependent methyltransferase